MFELRIAEEIEKEAVLSQDLIQEGFSHAFKAGELLQEVKSMFHSEEELQGWLESNCSQVEGGVLKSCMRLFNGETVSVQATKKEEVNHKRERG